MMQYMEKIVTVKNLLFETYVIEFDVLIFVVLITMIWQLSFLKYSVAQLF